MSIIYLDTQGYSPVSASDPCMKHGDPLVYIADRFDKIPCPYCFTFDFFIMPLTKLIYVKAKFWWHDIDGSEGECLTWRLI
jgi:hypothetical protein